MCDMLDPDDWMKSREVNGADIWFREYFNGNARANSGPIYEFAAKRWDLCLEAKRAIEAKADSTLRFVGMLAAAMIAFSRAPGVDHAVLAHLLPSLVFFAMSCIFAFAAMKSVNWPSPMNIKVALEECHDDEQRQRTQLAASLHCAIVAATFVMRRKSKFLDAANALAMTGVFALGCLLF